MAIAVLRQGDLLIATLPAEVTDTDLRQLQEDLIEEVGRSRARGVIVDLTAVDVVDSFAARTLGELAQAVRLRGARAVVVGIQPEVAFAMVQLGLRLDGIETALDFEDGHMLLRANAAGGNGGR